MPTRGDLTDSRRRYTPKGDPMATLAPGEPLREALIIRYGVCFLDRLGPRRWAPRPAWLDYLPLVWVRLDRGPDGYLKRTWKLEQGPSGPVYREQASATVDPPSGKIPKWVPGATKGTKRPRNARPVDVVALNDDEEAWTHGPGTLALTAGPRSKT